METQKRRLDLTKIYSRTLFVIPSGTVSMRSHSVGYRFKVASDFFYLTGVETHDAILLLAGNKTYLFSDFFKSEASVWGEEGFLTETDLKNLSGVEKLSLAHFESVLQDQVSDFDRLAAPLGRDQMVDQLLFDLISYQRRTRRKETALALTDSRTLIGQQRQIKSKEEIRALREAARRSSQVHRELLQVNFEGHTEIDVANWIEAQFLLKGMRWTAYETIVGSGERSTLLHARATDKKLHDGEWVLIDAGAEWQGYCADITRVMPVGKNFSQEQKNLYQVVLKAQKKTLESIKPGLTLTDLHEMAQFHLTEGLMTLNIVHDLDIKKLMPHSTSHWLGLDVHDPASYVDDRGQALRLQEGMVFTVEPGLYLRESIDANYKGLGIRIEDDVVMTSSGCEVLTDAPKELAEVEELSAKKKALT